VGVEDFDAARADFLRHPPRDFQITARATAQANDRDPLGEQLFSQGADGIEAKDRGFDARAEPVDRFRH
jgi:hypothetical protein